MNNGDNAVRYYSDRFIINIILIGAGDVKLSTATSTAPTGSRVI